MKFLKGCLIIYAKMHAHACSHKLKNKYTIHIIRNLECYPITCNFLSYPHNNKWEKVDHVESVNIATDIVG